MQDRHRPEPDGLAARGAGVSALRGSAVPTPGLRWRSPKPDGVAHLYPARSERMPALCGAPNQAEARDWPKGRRCPDCDAKAAEA